MKKGLFIFLVIILFNSCGVVSPWGEVNIDFTNVLSRSIVPADVQWDIVRYDLTLSGPNDESISETLNNSSSYNKENLASGNWKITVQAYAEEGALLAVGTQSFVIISNQIVSVRMELDPAVGTGSAELTVEWPVSEITNPDYKILLMDYNGALISTVFDISINVGQGVFKKDLSAGSYAIVIQFFDGETYLWGMAESLIIVGNEVTEWSKVLTKIDITDGGAPPVNPTVLALEIISNVQKPYRVYLRSVPTTWPAGTDQTISFSLYEADNYYDKITPDSIEWYVDGVILSGETSNQVVVGEGFHLGRHNISVIARKDNQVAAVNQEVYVSTAIQYLTDYKLAGYRGNSSKDFIYAFDKYWLICSQKLIAYDENMSKVEEHAVTAYTSYGGSCLTFDGTYFYMTDGIEVNKINPAANYSCVATYPLTSNVYTISWDGTNFWSGNYNGIQKYDSSWNLLSDTDTGPGINGICWIGEDLWIVDNTVIPCLYRMDANFNVLERHLIYKHIPDTDVYGNNQKSLDGILYDGEFIWVLCGVNSILKSYKVVGITP